MGLCLHARDRRLVAEAIIQSREEEKIKAIEKKQDGEKGLHVNAGLTLEQPCYSVARWRGRKTSGLVGSWLLRRGGGEAGLEGGKAEKYEKRYDKEAEK